MAYSQTQIIKMVKAVLTNPDRPPVSPFSRNSIEYRYWQDGIRVARLELEPQDG